MRVVEFIVWLFFFYYSVAANEREALFSSSWAVEVKGGYAIANGIASKHGFINRGQVGSLDGVYHFVHALSPTRSKRNINDFHPKYFQLKSEKQVGYVEQQIIKKRYKRAYSFVSNTNWREQWYLHRSNGHDMNVARAWKRNITGKGAVISILDDGIEYTHPDLQDNYDPLASYDFNDNDNDPIPRYDPTNENKHGTRCAGEVAAKRDGHCGVGAAYDSKIGGIRMLDGDVTDVVEASSLSLKPQHIHIYSSSWGPNDDGSTVDGPGKLASKAFEDGVGYGRNGLGSIYVWAAGNGGRYGDSCNCDGYAVSPLTISVGSTSERDEKPWYLEKCSSTLTSTYSSGDVNEKQIFTTDLHHSCTARHTGTSASAPLAAGMMALALEANFNLTWRDMQYLMVYASNPQYPHDDHWQLNGAGLKVSHWYGFGILDGAALVNRASNWITVPPRRNCTFNMTTEAKKSNIVTDDSPLLINIEAVDCRLAYLEHVQAVTSLNIQKGMRKDISIFLTSPASTKSVLLPYRSRDRHKDGFHLWPFMSVHYWGERPQGNWILNIIVKNSASVKLEALELILYGTPSIPNSVRSIPSQCHYQCLGGCAKEGPQYCDVCKAYQVAHTLECVTNCPPGTYQNENMCLSCPVLCAECDDSHSCTRCQSNSFLLPQGSCSKQCSDGTFTSLNNTCIPCHQSCFSCHGPQDTDCTSCHPQFIFRDNVCMIREPASCPSGQYFDHRAHECRLCHTSCSSCSGKESTQCTSCPEGAVTNQNGQCIDTRHLRSCNSGQYYDGSVSECAACLSTCNNCSNNLTCTSCQRGQYLTQDGTCVNKCPQNTIRDNINSVCLSIDCHHSCSTCFGPKPDHCNSCRKDFFLLNSSCKEYCPTRYYHSNSTCVDCHSGCESCVGPSEDQCSSCFPGDYLSGQKCVRKCPPGSYGMNHTCSPCMSGCFSCVSRDVCVRCQNGYYLLSGHVNNCVTNCPSGYVLHSPTSTCQSCPTNCAVCSSSLSCQSCSPDYVYYAPSGSCQATCPDGYYVSSTKLCVQCRHPCSTCFGSALNCSTCSTGMAMDMASALCRDCCNPDITVLQCCDCSEDNKFCHWTNSSYDAVTPSPTSHHLTTHLHATVGIIATSLIVLLCLVLPLIMVLHHRFKFCNSEKYQKVPNEEDSESNTELYSSPPVIIS